MLTQRDRPDRSGNPFTSSSLGGRVLSGSQLPFFMIFPPAGYGIIRTTGRRTGKSRLRCVRVVVRNGFACVVSIHGPNVGWLRNLESDPTISVRVRGGWQRAVATIGSTAISDELRQAYVDDVGLFCYPEYVMWRRGRPRRSGIRDLHRSWLDSGTAVSLEFVDPAASRLPAGGN